MKSQFIFKLLTWTIAACLLWSCGGENKIENGSGGQQAPVITKQPEDLSVVADSYASIGIEATGDGLTFQWYRNGQVIQDAVSEFYNIEKTTLGDNGSTFSVTVTNQGGVVSSRSAVLTVYCRSDLAEWEGVCIGPPTIQTQPVGIQVLSGSSASFSVLAAGDGLSYQWYRNGQPIEGANNRTYSISAPAVADDGATFHVQVINSAGHVVSNTVMLTVISRPVVAILLPHTGIAANQCYQVGSNTLVSCSSAEALALSGARKQDGMYAATNAMRYGKVGFNGEDLPDSAASWCAVKDLVTGMIWENHQILPGGYTNFGDGRSGDASRYAQNNASLCGLNGWRLPSIDELHTLADLSQYGNTVNTNWFANIRPFSPVFYWSFNVSNSGYPWTMTNYGYTEWYSPKGDAATKVRLVNNEGRSTSIGSTCPTWATAERFTMNAAEVTDKRTGLVWARCSVGQEWDGSFCNGAASTFTHEQALQYAALQQGWRLPNVRELFSLSDKGCSYPAIDSTAFPGTSSNAYWTSTPDVGDPSRAWSVYMSSGAPAFVRENRTASYRLRLVRALP